MRRLNRQHVSSVTHSSTAPIGETIVKVTKVVRFVSFLKLLKAIARFSVRAFGIVGLNILDVTRMSKIPVARSFRCRRLAPRIPYDGRPPC